MRILEEVVERYLSDLRPGGEVALPDGGESRWNPDSLASARRLDSDLLSSDTWLACVLPVGDGIGVAVRRQRQSCFRHLYGPQNRIVGWDDPFTAVVQRRLSQRPEPAARRRAC
jgi:hypothetical protein